MSNFKMMDRETAHSTINVINDMLRMINDAPKELREAIPSQDIVELSCLRAELNVFLETDGEEHPINVKIHGHAIKVLKNFIDSIELGLLLKAISGAMRRPE